MPQTKFLTSLDLTCQPWLCPPISMHKRKILKIWKIQLQPTSNEIRKQHKTQASAEEGHPAVLQNFACESTVHSYIFYKRGNTPWLRETTANMHTPVTFVFLLCLATSATLGAVVQTTGARPLLFYQNIRYSWMSFFRFLFSIFFFYIPYILHRSVNSFSLTFASPLNRPSIRCNNGDYYRCYDNNRNYHHHYHRRHQHFHHHHHHHHYYYYFYYYNHDRCCHNHNYRHGLHRTGQLLCGDLLLWLQ